MISLGFQVKENSRKDLIQKLLSEARILRITGLAFPNTAKLFIDKAIATPKDTQVFDGAYEGAAQRRSGFAKWSSGSFYLIFPPPRPIIFLIS